MAVAHISIELEIQTSEYLTDEELFTILDALKREVEDVCQENNAPMIRLQEINSKLRLVTVL